MAEPQGEAVCNKSHSFFGVGNVYHIKGEERL